jgi:CheY-like chemotaxis protein
MESDIRRSHEAGFRAHVTKPVDLATLRDVIRRVLEEGPHAVLESAGPRP